MFKTLDMILMVVKGILSFLKFCGAYFLGMAVVLPLEQTLTEGDFFIKLLDSIPSQVAMTFGVLYIAFIVFKKGSDAWFSHLKNRTEHRFNKQQNKETLEQEHIETEIKRKDLDG